jgi:serine-aspartate repeat-containing protein C/D/E
LFLSKKVCQLAGWVKSNRPQIAQPSAETHPERRRVARRSKALRIQATRAIALEAMEPRYLMAADPLQVGVVYIEEDLGSDLHGDTFIVTFQGGAEGALLQRVVIDGDLNEPGFGLGDLFFDTVEAGRGADHAFAFHVESLQTANPNATVKATVQDGSTKLILDFTNFAAGDKLTFSIDVDEVQSFDANETDQSVLNDGFDPITSGVEFQKSLFRAEFSAPHYEDASGEERFLNRYDPLMTPYNLPLPADNADGKRDRSAGTALQLQQVPKPVSLAGTVYVDSNEDLMLQSGEKRLAGVKLELFRLADGSYVSTGHSTTTDSNGQYKFGTALALMPGTYQVRETQPSGYYSVGATPGKLDGVSKPSGLGVGSIVSGNPDVLTEVALLLGDQHAIELNFAENLPASISGHACYVVTGFDCFSSDSEKAPLADVLIELRDATGNIVSTTRTLADGSYSFTNLRAGVYTLTEVTPTGLLEGDARVGSAGGVRENGSKISQITIGGGIHATDYDFCELPPSDLSGHTYFDQNNNGLRDAGETPLTGVLIELWDEAGSRIAETRTDAQGFYRFNNLRPGTYRLTETTPVGYIPGRAAVGTIGGAVTGNNDATGDAIRSIKLPTGSKGINYDFGEILAGSIAGRVISDINGNCIIDAAGEMPLPGVTIELLNANGSVIATTQTDADGRYVFEDLLPGTYAVREIQANGYFHGGQMAGSGGGDDSTADLIRAINVTPGSELVGYDFCEIPPSSIAGSVFVDADQDCLFDANEAPIAGVPITLLDASGNVVATAVTDANGNYEFKGLRPGQYAVRESQPGGFLQGGQRAGSGGGNDSVQDTITAINLTAGVNLVDYDFCELLPGSIAGVVFADLDFDCIQDANESSLTGVRIDLLDANGDVVGTTLTDAQGRYSFGNLRPGNYAVREQQPEGYFNGGQIAPTSGGDASVVDVISSLVLGSGQSITEANFCEIPPAELSGYVFQDGALIENATGVLPEDIRTIRDGIRTSDDTPIAGVTMQLRLVSGEPAPSSIALPGHYAGPFIEVQTDANGFYHFTGLLGGFYHVFQVQPAEYLDSLDTAGTTNGLTLNSTREIEQFFSTSISTSTGLQRFSSQQLMDAVLLIPLEAGQSSQENNFSEVLVRKVIQFPPDTPKPSEPPRVSVEPPVYAARTPLTWQPLLWEPQPLLIGFGHNSPQTWHLSVINGGYPRGIRNGEPLDEETVADHADRLNVVAWTVRGMKASTWRIVSTGTSNLLISNQRMVFDLPDATPLAGDFNGDGFDELALFVDGEWFIDVNGNGRWDESDIWLKLGTRGDQPVVGDWDGDGKDDVGVFGRKWSGDDRALSSETGLPDPENQYRIKPKNLPPSTEQAPDEPRLMKKSHAGQARADLIDHVFQFGSGKDIAVSGDFNGDGISTIGVYRAGRWTLDTNGDGKLTNDKDLQTDFGQPGDMPLVGDFDGDGIEELAVVRGNEVIVDSNGNGHIDATDQVFLLDSEDGTVIVGDFDGDGDDEPALHQSVEQRRDLEARRAG